MEAKYSILTQQEMVAAYKKGKPGFFPNPHAVTLYAKELGYSRVQQRVKGVKVVKYVKTITPNP